MVQVSLTSAAGILALLDENEEELKIQALQKLNAVVDTFWAEISDSLPNLEALSELESFKSKDLAAFVVSKVYYHLGEYDDSLNFALGAGSLLDPALKSEFTETIVSQAIDKYIKLRNKDETIDSRLEALVERMINKCLNEKQINQVVGIGLESRRIDVVEEAIKKSTNLSATLEFTLRTLSLLSNIEFRNNVLRLLVSFYRSLPEPDHLATIQCLILLDDFSTSAQIISELISGNEIQVMVAYQVAFDLVENSKQEFLSKLTKALFSENKAKDEPSSSMDVDVATTTNAPLENIRKILSGELSTDLHLTFLNRHNHTDMLILNTTKNAVEGKGSVLHSATIFANSFMNAGTTNHEFLKANLEWLSRATNWAKFSATASLGVIHKGHLTQSMNVLTPYLPAQGVSGTSGYQEGGALYALGLIHANHGKDIVKYLTDNLKDTQNEVIQHGACLGLGVAGMATDSDAIYEDLKGTLFTDSAVAGEAAGLAMGLIKLGTLSGKATDEMLQYAHETQHEKIIRGLALGLALIAYGREEEADALIEQLTRDKDPILRYGGVYAIAMAYAGTGSNRALEKLLHIAVSDTNDDTRRAAVIALGFILFKQPKQVPKLVDLLAKSYNPHVRYGSALALGISCAGTGLQEAIDCLEPLTKDNVDYVRQGALISLSMILIQYNEAMNPQVNEIRKKYETIIGTKNEDVVAKFGSILSQGILDAGGRNVTISLQSRSGHNNMQSIVGLMIFTQFWYWYPFLHFLSLAFTPTALICLNKDLKMPKFDVISKARPSLFAYPPPITPPSSETPEKVSTAVLSTTAKAQARAKVKAKDGDAMDVDEVSKPGTAEETKPPGTAEETKPAGEEVKNVEDKKQRKKEENYEKLENPARVLPIQRKFIAFKEGSRFVPLKKNEFGGIVMVIDSLPNTEAEYISSSAPDVQQLQTVPAEAKPPAPFEVPADF